MSMGLVDNGPNFVYDTIHIAILSMVATFSTKVDILEKEIFFAFYLYVPNYSSCDLVCNILKHSDTYFLYVI